MQPVFPVAAGQGIPGSLFKLISRLGQALSGILQDMLR